MLLNATLSYLVLSDTEILVTKPLSINNLILYVSKKSITLKLHYFTKSKFHNTTHEYYPSTSIRQCTYIRI